MSFRQVHATYLLGIFSVALTLVSLHAVCDRQSPSYGLISPAEFCKRIGKQTRADSLETFRKFAEYFNKARNDSVVFAFYFIGSSQDTTKLNPSAIVRSGTVPGYYLQYSKVEEIFQVFKLNGYQVTREWVTDNNYSQAFPLSKPESILVGVFFTVIAGCH